MKKLLSVLVILALLTTGVALADEKVTLSMWIWDDAQAPAMQAMIDTYESTHPNVKIELTSVAGVTEYNTKMQAVFGSASAPSVFWMNFNLGKEYIPMGVVQDLTDTGIDFSGLSEGITNAYNVDGRIYGVAKDTDSYAVYYNKALFDAAGV
ncbi:MAG: ABC transporter substrate-binding protein, partial [Aristaeellaceae bacterium]